MSQVLVRDIDPTVIEHLKNRAKQNGRSFESELRIILKDAALKSESGADRLNMSRKIRHIFAGRVFSDSTSLLREERNS